jgi:hypothetical protein
MSSMAYIISKQHEPPPPPFTTSNFQENNYTECVYLCVQLEDDTHFSGGKSRGNSCIVYG